MDENVLSLSREDGIARIRFVDGLPRNTIGLAFCREFAAITTALASDASIKVVVIGGTGASFSVGGDIDEFVGNAARIGEHVREMASLFHLGLAQLRHGSAAVVAAVNGMAAGGGLSLVLNADMAVAGRSAKFVSAYTRTGLTPDGGGTWLLPRIVGRPRAFDLMATNRALDADEALREGIVARVVDDDALDAEVAAVAASLRELPPGTVGSLRRLLNESETTSFEQQLFAEAESIAESARRETTMTRLESFVSRSRNRSARST